MKSVVSISVVFTDLVDSTALSARLGPAGAEALRTEHFSILRDAVLATGGTEVKNLGDGLMVVYPSLGGALDGAVAMQQNVERRNRGAELPLGVRIGVSTGDATLDDGDYFGEPVVEAARLCAKAEGGQILTTDVVRMQARRSDHGFRSLGPVELKGLPEPVGAEEVRWEPVRAAPQVRLPSRLGIGAERLVVGRDAELERLERARKAVFAGEGRRVVLLSGEPGIGKTTLVAHVARLAHDEGATVLYGRCDDELRVPYQPFVEALGGFVATASEDMVLALGPATLGHLSRLVPRVARRVAVVVEPPATEADAERHLLLGAVTDTLVKTATEAPVVLVLEDLHWADKSSVLLLRHLVAGLDRAGVLIIGTYRDSDLDAGHPLQEGLAALRRAAGAERVLVAGLDERGVVAMMEDLAGHELEDDGLAVARAIWQETGGNPFFTLEVLRHLAEAGAIFQQDGRWVAAAGLAGVGLPESVREVVGRRIRRLGESAQDVLAVASVLGRDFELPFVARVADLHEEDVLDALEEAVEASVLLEVDGRAERFTFVHALMQHTLYDELSPGRRARLHCRIAELLEQDLGEEPGGRVGELARHWIAANRRSDRAKAIRYARAAGQRALDALAPDEAIGWFRQALDLLDVESAAVTPERLDVLIALGVAQRQAGDPSFRATLLSAAAAAGEAGLDDRLVSATLANQRGMVSSIGTVDEERIALLERSLAVARGGDPRTEARLTAMLVAELTFSQDLPRVRALAAEAEALARRLDDESTLLAVLNVMFLPLWVPDDLDRTFERCLEAKVLAERSGDPVARFQAAANLVQVMASKADRAGMEAALEDAASLAGEIGQPHLSWQALYLRCLLVLFGGDADDADRLAAEGLEISSESGQPDALVIYGANLINVRLHQDRLEEILPFIAEAAAANPGLPSFAAAHAMALCETGRPADARPLLDAARTADFHRSAYDYVWLTTATVWAVVAAELEDEAAAEALLEQLEPFEAQGVSSGASFSGTVGSFMARLAAVVGRDDEALALFERADAQLTALGAPYWRARNQLEWARLLLRRDGEGDLETAARLLAEAEDAARRHGCPGVLARIEAVRAMHDHLPAGARS